ncbi:MAG: hypothetical protein EX254_07640 [Flavobacteriaceae bacterium]|nr:MAG: hypothetical protein EX254_07640 [Flavobacteriaceae bacterium]
MSKFESDLNAEQILTEYLDIIYSEIGFSTTRVFDSERQNIGIDLVITHKQKNYTIDEKSQLHYLNQRLPTFAFELDYLKKGLLKKGWLFDRRKATQFYFLVTEIILNNGMQALESKYDVESIKILSVNRNRLIRLLAAKSLKEDSINEIIKGLRKKKEFGRHSLPNLDKRREGIIHFNKSLAEQPINLVLKLDFLITEKVAKVIYPVS